MQLLALSLITQSPYLPIFGLIDRANFFMDDTKSQYPKSDHHIKGTSEHTKRMGLMICLGKKPNATQEVPYETIIRGFRSAWQQQFDGNH